MRSAYKNPPPPNGTPPQIGEVIGLGIGGGASIQADDASHGYVDVRVGRDASEQGLIGLFFTAGIDPMFVTADEAFDKIAITYSGCCLTVSWSEARLLEGTRLRINFEKE